MAEKIDRPSLTTNLETRYNSQKVGGSYDAKGPTPDEIFGIQEKYWTVSGFARGGNEGLGVNGSKQIESSLYRQGLDNRRYSNKVR